MSDAYRQALRDAVFATQMGLGWTVPNAVMQYAVPQREGLSIDVRALARRRDALTKALMKGGHTVLRPEGTFYLWVKAGGVGARKPSLSAAAFGHVGFTGTSLWLLPERETALVLLTNRVHPAVGEVDFQPVRAAFHARALRRLP